MSGERDYIERMFAEFTRTLDAARIEEWHASDRDMWLYLSERFIQWKYHEDIERANRHALYLKLRQEFETE